MQAFIPFYSNFYHTAKCLDNKRLNKQIVEGYQIISGRLSPSHANHPVVRMWKPFFGTLAEYLGVLCDEYTLRFNKQHKVHTFLLENKFANQDKTQPWFLDMEDDIPKYNDISYLFVLSQRVNLLRKNYSHYSKFFMVKHALEIYPDGYCWPISGGVNTKSYKDFVKWTNWATECKTCA